MEEASKLPLPDAFLQFLEENGLDPSIYTATESTPRYVRYPMFLCRETLLNCVLVLVVVVVCLIYLIMFVERLKPGYEAQIQEIEAEINCKLEKVDWLPGFYALPPEVQIANSKAYQEGKVRVKVDYSYC